MPEASLMGMNSNGKNDSDVLLYDGFDYDFAGGALGWTANGLGSIARNTTYKYAGVGCLGITTPATAGSIMRAWHVIPVSASTKLGVELYFAGQSPAENLDIIFFGLRYNSQKAGANDAYYTYINRSYVAVLDENGETYSGGTAKKLSEFDSSVGYDVDLQPFTSNVTWHYAKMVVDLSTRKYVSLQVDRIVADVSQYAPFSADYGSPWLRDTLILQLSARSNVLAMATLALYDEVRVTNEY